MEQLREKISKIMLDLGMPNNTALFMAFELFASEIKSENICSCNTGMFCKQSTIYNILHPKYDKLDDIP